ncbi:SDR family oxidoreductase [Variovorax sp.]|jgi:NAD(P)-dependent dehydrogenase (short-subunit alcohol dehydrogenase family)|uniref:SDR family oxidoreductase n=1 Tax=Variovorax sp. TaxID=1871043 RepID=UPI0012056F89|nr:SDR family oxidoreductase [Variovorax sp.]TAJ57671.1 MAG: SDR family oxidoreductase [Variovorax sp.]
MWNGNSLAGRRVLVTAGASGIGLEIVRAFAAAGARVFACDVQAEGLDRLSAELPEVGSCLADVSSEEQVARLFEATDRELGGLDVLVNNAGVAGPTGGIETLSLDDWNRTLAVNITGQFLCARLAVPRLRQGRNPSIVNLSSAAGHLGMPGRSPYSASKWAVIGFTKTLALELGPDGIRVNAILPGAVDGPRIRAVIAAKAQALGKPIEEVTRIYTSQSALNRMVTAGDIANMVLFAASDLAASVTGQELVVDGHTQALS